MINFLEKNTIFSWIITVLLAGFIFFVSSLSLKGISANISINSYIYHFTIFFLFSFFLLISLTKGKRKEIFFIGIILAIIYAFSDEFHQSFVPGRDSSLIDVLTDSIGILGSGIIYSLRF